MPTSKSAIKRASKRERKDAGKRASENSPSYNRISAIDPRFQPARFKKFADQLSRRHLSLLVQLRSGHVPLNKHLNRIRRAESSICPSCGMQTETVHHFLMVCPAYERQRRQLETQIGIRNARSIKTLLSHPKAIPYMFNYVYDTRRFAHTFKDLRMET